MGQIASCSSEPISAIRTDVSLANIQIASDFDVKIIGVSNGVIQLPDECQFIQGSKSFPVLLKVDSSSVLSFVTTEKFPEDCSIHIRLSTDWKNVPVSSRTEHSISIDLSQWKLAEGEASLRVVDSTRHVVLVVDFYLEVSSSPVLSIDDTEFAFENDGPLFRNKVTALENDGNNYKAALKLLLEKGRAVQETQKQLGQLMASFTSSIGDLGLSENIMIPTKKMLMVKQKEVAHFSSQFRADLLDPMQITLSALESKNFGAKKKAYYDLAKDYYGWVGKHLNSSENKDEKQLNKRIQFETARFDYYAYLLDYKRGLQTRQLLDKMAKFSGLNSNMASNFDEVVKKRGQFRKKLTRVKDFNELSNIFDSDEPIARPKTPDALKSPMLASGGFEVYKSGILWTFKGQGKQGWHKQWVVLEDSKLTEFSDWKEAKQLARSPIDLTFACIRSNERKNCFEIITTDNIKRLFQADSDQEKTAWMQKLNVAIGVNSGTIPTNAKTKTPLEIVLQDDSNHSCCDCGSEKVEWISINLLCAICIECSGVHRSLGTHISKVRSLLLDSFTSPEILELLKWISNNNVNSIYEQTHHPKLSPVSSSQERMLYIQDKYVHRKFMEKETGNVNNQLIKAIQLNSIPLVSQSLANGADVRITVNAQDTEISLFQYSLSRYQGTIENPVFALSELLLLNDAPIGEAVDQSLNNNQKRYWNAKLGNSLQKPIRIPSNNALGIKSDLHLHTNISAGSPPVRSRSLKFPKFK